MQAEIIKAMMRPLADGAVPESHHRAQQHVESHGAHGREADVGGEIQEGEVYGHREFGRNRRDKDYTKMQAHKPSWPHNLGASAPL